jgi:hypothetical protein
MKTRGKNYCSSPLFFNIIKKKRRVTVMPKLTPEQAWEYYVGDSIELFISLFRESGITDVKEMCKLYAKDIPVLFERPYAQDQLDRIAELLEQYVSEKGYDENKLYSKKELDELWDREVSAIVSLVKKHQR